MFFFVVDVMTSTALVAGDNELIERLLVIDHVDNRSLNQCAILDKMFHRWTINSMGKKRVKSCKGNINQCLRFNFR